MDVRNYKMQVPDWVVAILSGFEDREQPLSESEIATALRQAENTHQDMSPEEFKGYHAEWASFLLIEARKQSVWGTYFAPMMTATRDDGTPFYSPDIKDLDQEVVTHWEQRSRSVRHPIMRARYADLVWDMKELTRTSFASANDVFARNDRLGEIG